MIGYHTAAKIPNYWTYAKDFVLDDQMFEPVKSLLRCPIISTGSPGWSAKCKNTKPSSCVNAPTDPATVVTQMQAAVAQALSTGHGRHRCRLDRPHLAHVRQARVLVIKLHTRPGYSLTGTNDSADA